MSFNSIFMQGFCKMEDTFVINVSCMFFLNSESYGQSTVRRIVDEIVRIARFGDASSLASNCQLKTNGLNNFLLSLVVLHGTGIFTYMNG